jgi:hypothetical protein
VALIAGTGLAHAQGTGMGHESPAAGAPAEHGAAATGHGESKATAMGHDQTMPSSGMKAEQSEPKAAHEQRAEENSPGQKSPGMNAEMNDHAKGGDKAIKAEGRDDRNGMKAENGEDRHDMKAEGRDDRNGMKAENGEDRRDMKAEGRDDRNGMKAENGEERRDMKAEGRDDRNAEHRSETVGQAGAGARLSSEQRSRITTVIRGEHVQPVEHVNFAISVGTRVPRDIAFYPLPEQIVTIYPDWRGYEFFLVGDQIVVIDPRTFEIVAVLEA